jgi:hypothetical protein
VRGMLEIRFVCSLLVLSATFGVANASVSRVLPEVRKHGGWIAPKANAKHAWPYVSSAGGDVVDIYDIEAFETPVIGQLTDGIARPVGAAIDGNGTV